MSESVTPAKVLVGETEAKTEGVVISSRHQGLSSAEVSERNGRADSVETGGSGYFHLVTNGLDSSWGGSRSLGSKENI